MARALRRALAAAGIAVFAMTAASPTSVAGIAPSTSTATVASVRPYNGQTVGVAHPIVVTFTAPVSDRAAAERSIQVTAPAPMSGKYEWRTDSTVAFVPDHFWPAHSQITMMAGRAAQLRHRIHRARGRQRLQPHLHRQHRRRDHAADARVLRQAEIRDPDRLVQRAGEIQVHRDGLPDHRYPANRPRGLQADGCRRRPGHLGGVYIHSAPWSVGSQGYANVSHGCVNLSPDNALWYFNQVGIGDPVVLKW